MDQNSGIGPIALKKGATAHLLVIRLSAMGDVAMVVPVLSALWQQYPKVRITVLTRANFKPIFDALPMVKVYGTDLKGRHKGLMGLYRLYRELLNLNLTGVADLHHVLRSIILRQLFKWGGMPCVHIDKGRAEKRALTAVTKVNFGPLRTTHQRYADVFAAFGYRLDLAKAPFLSKRPLAETTSKLLGKDTRKRIGIAPFAAFEGKRYPLAMMELVLSLLPKDIFQIILFGGGKAEFAELEQLANRSGTISIAGKLAFAEELALISNLDLMVSMDSGNAHLAANYGIPTVTLWGVTHPYAGFYPFGQPLDHALLANREDFPLVPTSIYGNKMPKGYEAAIASIPPEKVVQKIREVMTEKS